ncbi:hypothetical protein [Falsiroseomonas sp. HW251]|uniref:hypothetical protein n=1 Tax=Falsiroseomonas sp. HW251 TaxID=3390998 RepID=UPI003D311FF6
MSETVVLLPREIRLVVERLLLLTPLPFAFVPAVRDVVLYSAIAGLGGLPLLLERLEELKAADPRAIRVAEPEPGRFEVDCGGQHAWVALPSLLDLAAEGVALHGSAVVTASELRDPEELLAAAGLGRRQGVLAFGAVGPAQVAAPCADVVAPGRLRIARASATLFAAPAPRAGTKPGLVDPLLARALRDGMAVPAAIWWRAHHLSNTALAPDTVESRRHAGPVIVMPDGSLIGRKDNDDDTDFSLLTSAAQANAN